MKPSMMGQVDFGRLVYYERRRPEDTTLYQLVGEHLETFLA